MALLPNIVIDFRVDGEDKSLSYRKVPFSAWSELKRDLKFTPLTLSNAMGEFDVEAFAAIIWLERRQHERSLSWASVRSQLQKNLLDFEIVDLRVDEDEEEPDPTDAGS